MTNRLTALNPAGHIVAIIETGDRRVLRKLARRISRGQCQDGLPKVASAWYWFLRSSVSADLHYGVQTVKHVAGLDVARIG